MDEWRLFMNVGMFVQICTADWYIVSFSKFKKNMYFPFKEGDILSFFFSFMMWFPASQSRCKLWGRSEHSVLQSPHPEPRFRLCLAAGAEPRAQCCVSDCWRGGREWACPSSEEPHCTCESSWPKITGAADWLCWAAHIGGGNPQTRAITTASQGLHWQETGIRN